MISIELKRTLDEIAKQLALRRWSGKAMRWNGYLLRGERKIVEVLPHMPVTALIEVDGEVDLCAN